MSEESDRYMEYAEILPKEIRLTIESLQGQNELRYAVVMLLLNEGYLAFSKIEDKLDVHPQKLSEALDALQEGGLVRWQAEDDLTSRTSGNYCMTSYGESIIEAFYHVMGPKYDDRQKIKVDLAEIDENKKTFEEFEQRTTRVNKRQVPTGEVEVSEGEYSLVDQS